MNAASIQQALSYFVSMGWTLQQSCGIVANLWAESQLNPAAVGDGGAAYGIAQWHPDRQAGFAALLGKPIQGSSLADQLAWVNAELMGTEHAAGAALHACTTAAEAGACVSTMYERPADAAGEAAKRGALAEQIFTTYGGTVGATGSTSLGPAPTAPTASPTKPETTVPIALALLPLIGQLLPQLITAFGKNSPQALANANVATAVGTALQAAIPAATSLGDAVDKLSTMDDAAKATVAQQVVSHPDVVAQLNAMGPILDRVNQYDQGAWAAEEASRNAAQQRGLQQQEGGPLYDNPTFIIAMIMLVLVFVVVCAVLFKGGFSTDMQAFVIGAIVGGGLTAVLSFYFGSSRNSAAKDVTISQLANKGNGS